MHLFIFSLCPAKARVAHWPPAQGLGSSVSVMKRLKSLPRRSLLVSPCSVASGDEMSARNRRVGSFKRKPRASWPHDVSWPPMPAGHIKLSEG
jgi:hypothetical protein